MSVLAIRALLFGVFIGTSDCSKIPISHECPSYSLSFSLSLSSVWLWKDVYDPEFGTHSVTTLLIRPDDAADLVCQDEHQEP